MDGNPNLPVWTGGPGCDALRDKRISRLEVDRGEDGSGAGVGAGQRGA